MIPFLIPSLDSLFHAVIGYRKIAQLIILLVTYTYTYLFFIIYFVFNQLRYDTTMSDKKTDDYTIRMPESGYREEKEPFVIPTRPPRAHAHNNVASSLAHIENNPLISILAYCLSSISMTVVYKYVVSGHEWNMNFFYLAVQVSRTTREKTRQAWPPPNTNTRSLPLVHRLHSHNRSLQAIWIDQEPSPFRREQGQAM